MSSCTRDLDFGVGHIGYTFVSVTRHLEFFRYFCAVVQGVAARAFKPIPRINFLSHIIEYLRRLEYVPTTAG